MIIEFAHFHNFLNRSYSVQPHISDKFKSCRLEIEYVSLNHGFRSFSEKEWRSLMAIQVIFCACNVSQGSDILEMYIKLPTFLRIPECKQRVAYYHTDTILVLGNDCKERFALNCSHICPVAWLKNLIKFGVRLPIRYHCKLYRYVSHCFNLFVLNSKNPVNVRYSRPISLIVFPRSFKCIYRIRNKNIILNLFFLN